MENFLSNIIDLIDKYYHQRKLNKILLKLNLKIIFDIGAHKGEFSSNIFKYFKSPKIYAFEPQSEIYVELEKRFYKSKNFFPYNKALSDKNKKKKIKYKYKIFYKHFFKI